MPTSPMGLRTGLRWDSEQVFDVLVIGGGIVGAGVARDAALRGFSVALVEQNDFASGTSSKTTKLIHGGIRYLEQLQFKLVMESCQERKRLLDLAPHLVKPLPFLVPVYRGQGRPLWKVRLGVTIYDRLASGAKVGQHRLYQATQALEQESSLRPEGLLGGMEFYDAQMDDVRLCLANVFDAQRHGAVIANYTAVVQLLRRDAKWIAGAEVKDRLTGRRHHIQAKVVVNAAGPWVDRIRQLDKPQAKPLLRPTKGIHLLYPKTDLRHALVLTAKRDQRVFFVIPWRGLTLIGTTDTDFEGDPGEARADQDDVHYLVEEVNRLVPKLAIDPKRIITTFAGVRPLVWSLKREPWHRSREHTIEVTLSGLVSVAGGKFTTYRIIAKEVVDRAVGMLGKLAEPCRTAHAPFRSEDEEIVALIAKTPALGAPIAPNHRPLKAHVVHAVRHEMATSLSDLMWRRLQLGTAACQGLDCARIVAALAAPEFQWDTAEVKRQVDRYLAEVAAGHAWRAI